MDTATPTTSTRHSNLTAVDLDSMASVGDHTPDTYWVYGFITTAVFASDVLKFFEKINISDFFSLK